MQSRRILGGEKKKKFPELKVFSQFELCNVWSVIANIISTSLNFFENFLTLFFPTCSSRKAKKHGHWFGSSEDARAQPHPEFRGLNPAINI
jgi:hypothetical protein